MHCIIKFIHFLQAQPVRSGKEGVFMLKNEEIDELVIERLNQIYKKLSESKEIKENKRRGKFCWKKIRKKY